MKISYILAMSVVLMIAGISAAGATPGQTLACNTAGCHAYPPTMINVTTDATSTLTVSPGQAFKVNITWSGGDPTDKTEVNWPTDFSSIGLTRNNLLFKAAPRIPASMEATPNGTTNSTLTAPAVPGQYTVRVYASRGTSTTAGTNASVPKETDFKDINITVQAPPTGPNAPNITANPATSMVSDTPGATRTFSITANQTVNVTWSINGSQVLSDTNVTTSSYTNTSAALGTWNVTAVVSNTNGEVSQMWNWIVQPATSGLASIAVTPAQKSVTTGDTVNFTATPMDQSGNQVNATITWNSSNTTVGSIDATTGMFTAMAPGNATISATSGNITGTANVTVTTSVPGTGGTIVVTPATTSVLSGDVVNFTASLTDQSGNPVNATITWSSSNTTVGTIDATNETTGMFTALAPGNTTVTATSGNITGTANVTVLSTTPVPGTGTIVVTPATTSVLSGDVVNFTASDQSGNPINATITWNSSNTTVGPIDTTTGVFTAIAPGNTTISATSGNLTGTANVIVTASVPALNTIVVTPSTTSVTPGDIVNFTATPLDQSGNPINATITWSSSNITVGSIDVITGMFTAVEPGNATITATSGTITGTANVTVTAPVPALNTIVVTPSTTSVLLGAVVNFTATPLDQSGDPVNATITWNSSDTTVGTISAINDTTGMFTAVAQGNTTISATSGNITGTANVTVLSTTVTGFGLKPDATAALKGDMIKITITALSGNNTQTLYNGTANITIDVNTSTVVISPANVSFTNGMATITITSNITQFVNVTAANANITGSTTVVFADRVFPLEKGWNLISIPNNANPSNVSQALQNIQYNAIFSFDPANSSFSTPTVIQPLFGYWINVTAANQSFGFIADTTVVSSPPQRNLYEGWNLIGVNANRNDDPAIDITAGDLFAGLENNQIGKYYSILVSYDKGVNNPETFSGEGLTNNIPLKQGHGYWLFIDPLFNRPQNNLPWAGTGKPW